MKGARKKATPAPKRRRTGRPPGRKKGDGLKLTLEITNAIAADLALAIPFETAVGRAGIALATAYEWRRKGEEGKAPYAAFAVAVTRARCEAVRFLTLRALAGGKGSSNATWFLERRYPKDYGSRQRLEITGNDGSPIEHEVRIDPVNDAAARALLEAALGRNAQS